MEKFSLGMLTRREESGLMSASGPDLWPGFEFILLEE